MDFSFDNIDFSTIDTINTINTINNTNTINTNSNLHTLSNNTNTLEQYKFDVDRPFVGDDFLFGYYQLKFN